MPRVWTLEGVKKLGRLIMGKRESEPKEVKKGRVLVVGGRGFIGSHLIQYLQSNYSFKVDVLDLKDGKDVRDGIDGKYDVIVHLACAFGESQEAADANDDMIDAIDDYAVKNPKTHIIYTSSAAVYPSNEERHIEDGPTSPSTNYGLNKLTGENIISMRDRYTILRLSNVYGEGGSGAIDLFKSGKRTIYGDGEQVRDFVPVEVVVDVIARAITHPKRWQGVFNVSSGHGVTINSAFEQYGKGGKHYSDKGEPGVRHSILDNSKMKAAVYGSK
jgi:UDP-glucose 4-epimerase